MPESKITAEQNECAEAEKEAPAEQTTESAIEDFTLDDIEVIESKVFA